MMNLNHKLFYLLNGLAGHSPFVDSLIVFIASDLPWIIIAVTISYFLFFQKSIKKFLVLCFMVGLPIVLTQFLKWIIFKHPRPFVGLPDVVKLIDISSFDSFPSGHATVFAAITTAVFIYDRTLGVIFIFATLLIGIARIAAGVHYPLDILTGFVIGFVVSILAYILLKYLSRAIKRFVS